MRVRVVIVRVVFLMAVLQGGWLAADQLWAEPPEQLFSPPQVPQDADEVATDDVTYVDEQWSDDCDCCRGGRCQRGGFHSWCSTCDMYQHFPYRARWNGYYYFRPYNFVAVKIQKDVARRWGQNPHNPYDNRFFDKIYKQVEAEVLPPADEASGANPPLFDHAGAKSIAAYYARGSESGAAADRRQRRKVRVTPTGRRSEPRPELSAGRSVVKVPNSIHVILDKANELKAAGKTPQEIAQQLDVGNQTFRSWQLEYDDTP